MTEVFDQIIISFPDQRAAEAANSGPVQSLRGSHPKCSITCTSDPWGTRVGSGGGTLASLPPLSEHDRVLVVHAGGESSRCPTQMVLGKAWTTLPCSHGVAVATLPSMRSPLDVWLQHCETIFRGLPSGSIVAIAADTLLHWDAALDVSSLHNQWSTCNDTAVVGLAVPVELGTAKNHGVYALEDPVVMSAPTIVPCTAVYQKPSIQVLTDQYRHWNVDGQRMAWIDTGVVVFLPRAAARFRSLAGGPLMACTAFGIESLYRTQSSTTNTNDLLEFAKKTAIKVDLYTHILQALDFGRKGDADMRCQEYCNNHKGTLPEATLRQIFQSLCQNPLLILAIPVGSFLHLGTTRELCDFLLWGSSPVDDPNFVVVEQIPPRKLLCGRFGRALGLTRRMNCLVLFSDDDHEAHTVHPTSVVVNCIMESPTASSQIGEYSVIEHCHIRTDHEIKIGSHCLVSSVRQHVGNRDKRVHIPDSTIVQMIPLSGSETQLYAWIVLGMQDGIKEKNTLYNRPFEDFLSLTYVDENSLWVNSSHQILWTAHLHPVVDPDEIMFADLFSWLPAYMTGKTTMSKEEEDSLIRWRSVPRVSLQQIGSVANAEAEFHHRQFISDTLIPQRKSEGLREIRESLLQRKHHPIRVHHVVRDFAASNCIDFLCEVLICLDEVLEESLKAGMLDVTARTCHVISTIFRDVLDVVPLESSDPANRLLSRVIEVSGRVLFSNIFRIRDNPTLSLQRLVAAIENAAQEMIARWVLSLTGEVSRERASSTLLDQWVVAVAPARIDIAGGWSDTPPVCFEFGAAVTGMAVLVDGKFPVSCRCRIVSGGEGILLRSELRDIASGELVDHVQVMLSSFKELCDYTNPESDCALLKCALVCLGLSPSGYDDQMIIKVDSFQSLINAFCSTKTNVRIELAVTSLLPKGSGLGTSSILGGCVLLAMGRCIGRTFLENLDDRDPKPQRYAKLIHQVLVLEQMLTTGGGFQDQVHGLIGGIKIVRCQATCNPPFRLDIDNVSPTTAFYEMLNHRLMLAFTGKTRLAKNILTKVLVRWAERQKHVVTTVTKLIKGAESAREAIEATDMMSLGTCLDEYWQLKKSMAGLDNGVEPNDVKIVISKLKSEGLISGASLCGAGGGGFMVLLLEDGASRDEVKHITEKSLSTQFAWHDCCISMEGVCCELLDRTYCDNIEHFEIAWHENNNS